MVTGLDILIILGFILVCLATGLRGKQDDVFMKDQKNRRKH